MKSNKRKNILIITTAGLISLALVLFFIVNYLDFGSYSRSDSLFYLLTKIDYAWLLPYFLGVSIVMFILDNLVIVIQYYWNDFNAKISKPIQIASFNKTNLKEYWHEHRTIHLTFILLTIFLTIAITAPASIMNTFTAIVSISVLVSNLTKNDKKEK